VQTNHAAYALSLSYFEGVGVLLISGVDWVEAAMGNGGKTRAIAWEKVRRTGNFREIVGRPVGHDGKRRVVVRDFPQFPISKVLL